MNQHPQHRQASAPIAMASTAAEARKLAENLMDVMSALLGVIERETELVRAGKIREAMNFEPKKTELSRRYVNAIAHLKASQKYLFQTAPELLNTLHRHHDVFRAMLQVNLTVLATAHAVSESIVRGVNTEMQRRNIPDTYTAAGKRAAPGPRNITPLAVSRSLYRACSAAITRRGLIGTRAKADRCELGRLNQITSKPMPSTGKTGQPAFPRLPPDRT
jgi:hypothetical protein